MSLSEAFHKIWSQTDILLLIPMFVALSLVPFNEKYSGLSSTVIYACRKVIPILIRYRYSTTIFAYLCNSHGYRTHWYADGSHLTIPLGVLI